MMLPSMIQQLPYVTGPPMPSSEVIVNQIADVIKNQFGLKPKEQAYMYRKPYPESYDKVPMPLKYKVPDFTKFSGQDTTSTVEHISRILIQCGEAANEDALKIWLFPLSLSGSAFSLFSSLPSNSVITWADEEKQFHSYFFVGVYEMKITDPTTVKQRNGESVSDYIQRFRGVRSRCYSLKLRDSQLTELAIEGLLPHIKEKFSAQGFENLSHLASRLSNVDVRFQEQHKSFPQKKVSYIDYLSESEEEA